ncbi:MAG TPA: hypothetical protein PKJ32_20355, partial [Piscinibacter sp.]|nr:hypothetical protein [Piscinibacter sp.]
QAQRRCGDTAGQAEGGRSLHVPSPAAEGLSEIGIVLIEYQPTVPGHTLIANQEMVNRLTLYRPDR